MMRLSRELAQTDFEALLGEFQQVVGGVLERMGGSELEVEADTITAVFSTAKHASLAAVAAQHAVAEHKWPQGRILFMSVGLGSSADRCAELCDAAEGGQIFLTPAVSGLLAQEPLNSLFVRDLGEVALRRSRRTVPACELMYPAAGTYHA